ncbi:MAG: hypothetical protein ACK47B_08955 [Armatimonadota bacterium]
MNEKQRFTLQIAARAGAALARQTLTPRRRTGPVEIYLALVDHFEPSVGRPSRAVAHRRLEDWLTRYPQVAGRHRDADGRHPAHTFCYPWDELDPWELDRLAELCAEGWGEIELHLHHRDDTEATLRTKLREALRTYRAAGALSEWPDGRTAFGFVHGNWALDNSRCDDGRNFCGVNSEISVLIEEGCYADFTFPAWQQTAQPRQVSSIFYAVDDPARPKSHDRGLPARAGASAGAGLPIIQGPLVPFLKRRGWKPLPAMDDGDLAAYRRYEPARLDRWVRAGIHVAGCPDRVFIKLHCHGAEDANRQALLGEDLEALFTDAEARYNDGERYRLHYVSAREMFNTMRAIETVGPRAPLSPRDWLLPRPQAAAIGRGRELTACTA